VLALACCAFVFNTSEFVPVGLLHAIGHSFDMKPTDVGLMMTIYAWAVAILSLPLTLFTNRIERRKLLVWVCGLFIVSHVLTGIAWNFPVLVLGRIGIACAHAVFWSISVPLAVRVAPAEKKSRALALFAMGTSVAMVAGIPLGRVIGEVLGWRMTFLSIAGVTGLALLMLWLTLPALPSQRAGSLKSLPALFARPRLLLLYLLAILTVSAHFTAYTYIEPFMHNVTHAAPGEITFLLLLFGAAGVPAAAIFHRFYNDRPEQFLLATVIVLSLCLLVLLPCATSIVTLSVHSLVWGCALICFNLAMQAWVLSLAHDASDLANSIFSGLYNVGIGGGALLGNVISDRFGLNAIGNFGGVIGAAGVVVCWLAMSAAFGKSKAAMRPD
jgi:DHA1 family L-arabinose/isopropyl-beta-D-thiogalactopyranoside export protein-like MFS transporter